MKRPREAALLRYAAGGRAARMYEENLPLIEEIIAFVSRSCRFPPEDAKDFAQDVHVKLYEDDCRVLRERTGASLRNYLKVVIGRTSQDFRNHLWGKYRDSTEAKRLGSVALKIERMLVRDGLTVEETRRYLRFNEKIELSDEEFDLVRVRLPAKMKRQLLAEEHLVPVPTPGPDPAEALAGKLAAERQREIFGHLDRCTQALPTEQQLLLRLHFTEGLKFSDIAHSQDVPQKPLYAEKNKALRSLQACLIATGITWDEIRETFRLLGGPAGPDGAEEE